MTRVLVIIPSLTPEAGAESSMAACLPLIVEQGVQVDLALLSTNQGLAPQVEAGGVVLHDLSGHRLAGQVVGIRRLIDLLRPDVVHSTLFQATLPAQIAGLRTGIPGLVTWASTPTDPRFELVASWKLRVVHGAEMALAHLPNTYFHAVVEGVATTKAKSLRIRRDDVAVAERGRDRSVYRPLGSAERAKARAELGIEGSSPVLLSVGRQEAAKGYVDLLRSFDQVADRIGDVRLLVAGRSGSASSEIEATLAGMRHADRVSMLGHRNDISTLLATADAIVCSSHREGAAGALIEAMACGTPIVSVDLDGMAGVLEDGVNAVVVPRSRLTEGILQLLEDPAAARDRAAAATRLFEERFTIEQSALALLKVYRWAAAR